MTDESWDVLVVGGGAAGLAGALSLARARRSVLVVDSGRPRNAPAHAVHNLLGHDGTPPSELLERGRSEVVRHGGEVTGGEVVAARPAPGPTTAFEVDLADGRTVRARRLLVTTGTVDELPPVAGLRERWGQDVVHCPYCHGWEVRDQRIGVLASSPMSLHQAQLFRQWTPHLTYLAGDEPVPTEALERLEARGTTVVHGAVAAVEVREDRLVGVRLADGTVVPLDAVAVASRMVPRGALLASLGLATVEHPSGMGVHVPAGPTGATDVPGVWVAGNVTDLAAQVGAAASQGALAAGHVNMDLVTEDTDLAVAARREDAR